MCIFCKIASGEIPSNKLYEDDKVLAFYDLDPQAPTHFLVIPKEHIASAAEITPENAGMVAHIFATIARICAEHGWETVLNRAGTTFRKLDDAAKADLDQARAIELMLAQPSMIKRPVLDLGDRTLIGFKPDLYAAALL